MHRHGDDLFDHATGAGSYDNALRRTPESWRLTSVRRHLVWRSGTGPIPGEGGDNPQATSS